MAWDITKPLTIKPDVRLIGLNASEKGFIFANYKTMSAREMARRLGRSNETVSRFLHKYNLKQNTEKQQR